jgi:hypothetical protein
MMPFTKIAVESRGGFYPFLLQIKFYKTVINEKVTPYEFNKLLCSKMIPDISKTNTGGNATGSSQGTEKRCLGNAETSAAFQHIARTIMLREIKRRIRIIKDTITYSKIKLHGNIYRIFTSANNVYCIIPDSLMITINNGCWSQIRQMLFPHLLTPP